MEKKLIESMEEKYEEYLIDESKYRGYADSISFPESEEQVCQILRQMKEQKIPVTIQGGKTGIVGGAVPLPPQFRSFHLESWGERYRMAAIF